MTQYSDRDAVIVGVGCVTLPWPRAGVLADSSHTHDESTLVRARHKCDSCVETRAIYPGVRWNWDRFGPS